ncbi:MAG: ribonuclease HII [Actinomycetota bacterium]|nr:MAG: ribonuclease HII [Actinomycetota bacterium]
MGAVAVDLGRYERELRAQGFSRIAGVDEAGRGALAGPLVAGAVILPEGFELEGLADSKALSPAAREALFERIVREAVAWSVRRCTPARIDRRGLHRMNLWLLRRCVRTLPVEPDYVLSDGFAIGRLPVPSLSIRKGDAVVASVAAASILAKVVRDRIMDGYHRRFPVYGFDRNRGYGTRDHLEALRRYGPCPIHRRSFAGVADPAAGGPLDEGEA